MKWKKLSSKYEAYEGSDRSNKFTFQMQEIIENPNKKIWTIYYLQLV